MKASFPSESVMDASTTVEQWQTLGQTLAPAQGVSKTVSRLSLLTAVVASQTYLIHATFFGHSLTPIGVYVVDPNTHRHLMSGQIGKIEEVFYWNGLISTIVIAVSVSIVSWMSVRGIAKVLARCKSKTWSGTARRNQQPQVIATGETADISSGEIA